eukprot:CAMPEP_0172490910 /NCGR_PEP_ID=MMETSP1066-20121228/21529_1 /TAXON_ID=671091 /ORGANISM="Coscinodiscus wailesii, Strain CCMP2513" /LENGTH=47 /DNA_ID= /DNA_START= /DNA_END= /DNA_ORIENTATION=
MSLDAMKDSSASNANYYGENADSQDTDLSPLGGVVGFFFLLSLYWTH